MCHHQNRLHADGCHAPASWIASFVSKARKRFTGLFIKPAMCVRDVVLLALLGCHLPALAGEARVAVAANFTAPIKKIAPQFEQATGHKLLPSFGSTGKLYAQIRNGAPFDIFLAADVNAPNKLEQEGIALPATTFTYATGKLVLWSAKTDFVDSKGKVLAHGNFSHLALVNPKLAPYGLAAMQTIRASGLDGKVNSKIVYGENLMQAYQYIASGNAELGFIALSQIYRDGHFSDGSAWLVPASLYTPIRQNATLLMRGQGSAAARAFMKYLKGEPAKAIIRSFGYDT